MKIIDKIKSVTPKKKRKFVKAMSFLAGAAALTGVLFPFTLPVTGPIAAYLTYLATSAATETIKLEDVKQMDTNDRNKLFVRLRDKNTLTDHDQSLMEELLKDGEEHA